jgi:hypothetical protein
LSGAATETPGRRTATARRLGVGSWVRRFQGRRRADTLGALALLPRGLGAAVFTEVCLQRTELPRVARWLNVPLEEGPATSPTASEALGLECRRAMMAARLSLRLIHVEPTCLRQSLVAGHLLRSKRPRLRIGAANGPEGFRAHAWLEIDGSRLPNDGADEYTPLSQRGPSA